MKVTEEMIEKLKQDPLFEQVNKWVEEDKDKIVQFASGLIQCKTPSNIGDTREAADYIKKYLDEHGFTHETVLENKIMPNVISKSKLGKEGKRLMLNGHLDVMPAGSEDGWTDDPWSGRVEGGKIWGRGSSDMKCGVTALLFAYTYLNRLRDQLKGEVSFSVVSDEETGYGRGTGTMFKQRRDDMMVDCVMTAEPSGVDAYNFSSKGYIQFTTHIKTRGAIAGLPADSKSSIEIAADIIRDLKTIEDIKVNLPDPLGQMVKDEVWCKRYDELYGENHAALLDRITVDICTIHGGDLISVIAASCSLATTIVVPIGTDPYMIFDKAREIVEKYPEASFVLECIDAPDFSYPEHEIVDELQTSVQALGWPELTAAPEVCISDMRYWRYVGVPAFWYGLSGETLSAANEYANVEDLLHLVRVHTLTAIQYLRGDKEDFTPVSNSYTSERVSYEPAVRSLAAVRMAAISQIAAKEEAKEKSEEMIDDLFQRLTDLNVAASATSSSVFTDMEDGTVKVTACIPVGPEVEAGDTFEVVTLPKLEKAVTALHRGSSDASGTKKKVDDYVKENGLAPGKVYRENYIIGQPYPEDIWAVECVQELK